MQVHHNNLSTAPEITPLRKKWYKHSSWKILLKGLIAILPILILYFLLSLALKIVLNILAPISALLFAGSDVPRWISCTIAIFLLVGFFY